METILSLLVPALLLAYYWRIVRTSGQGRRLPFGLLVGGTCLYYIGMLLTLISSNSGTLLQLTGACMFFTGVALHTLRRPVTPPSEAGIPKEDDSNLIEE